MGCSTGTANSGSDNVNAQPEVLACIGGLSTTLAAPTVTKIRIVQSSIAVVVGQLLLRLHGMRR